ncbi:MAG: hypothetical protein IKC32_05445 [Clostridia bacterium]|nr:hypothetical protein [Clostridia bacterium]
MKTEFYTPRGALVIESLPERPSSFYSFGDSLTLFLYPSERADLEAKLMAPSGVELYSPVAATLYASQYLSYRGIPTEALTLCTLNMISEVPLPTKPQDKKCYNTFKCKQLSSKYVNLSGGMPHLVHTVDCGTKTRVIEAPARVNLPHQLLCRLLVVDGMDDCVRSIAFRGEGLVWYMASTDETLTVDSVLPLAHVLSKRGIVGEVTVICRGESFSFYIAEPRDRYIYLPAIKLDYVRKL